MSDDAPRDARRSEIDWRSPRWREGDARQGEVERQHRFRDNVAPTERGAIDRDGSVGRGEKRSRSDSAEESEAHAHTRPNSPAGGKPPRRVKDAKSNGSHP